MSIGSTAVKVIIKGDSSQAEAAFKRVQKEAKNSIKIVGAMGVAAAASSAAFAVGKIREFEKSMSDLSAITGATGKDLDFLRRKSLEYGASTTLSASQAAEAFKLIASAKPDLLDNAAALAKVTRETITLSEAAGIALPDAANALGSSLNQFNADAAESARFINVLAAGAKFGSSEIAQTAEALKIAGTVASGTGLSFEQTNAAIQAMASVAIKGSEAGTGLRGVLLKLSTQSRNEFNPEIVGFTKAIQNLEKAHLSTTEKTKLFGLESITAANALIKEAGNLDTLTGKLTGTNTAYDQASIRVNNLDGDIKKLMSAVEGAGLSFQKDLNPELRSMVQLLTDSVNGFATFISVMSGAKTQIALAVKLQDLREQLKGTEDDFRSLVKNGAASFSMLGVGMLGGVDGRMSKLAQTIKTLKKSIKDTELERQVKIMENAGANIDAYFQAVDAGSSKAEASLIAFAQAKADAFVDTASAPPLLPQDPIAGSVTPGAPSDSSSPAVNQALIDAQKIIDIHSVKFQQMQIMGQAAFDNDEALLLARNDADIFALENERTRLIDATALQIEDKTARLEALAGIDNYYDQLTLDRAMQTTDEMDAIRAKDVAQTLKREKQRNSIVGSMQATAYQQGVGFLQLFAGKNKEIALLLIAMQTAKAVSEISIQAASASAQVTALAQVESAAHAAIFDYAGAAAAQVKMAAQISAINVSAALGIGLAVAGGAGQGFAAMKGGGSNAVGTFSASPMTGLPSSGSTTPVTQTPAAQAPAQQITIIIDGVTSVDHIVNNLVPVALRDQITNNDLIIIDPRSRQAAVQQAA